MRLKQAALILGAAVILALVAGPLVQAAAAHPKKQRYKVVTVRGQAAVICSHSEPCAEASATAECRRGRLVGGGWVSSGFNAIENTTIVSNYAYEEVWIVTMRANPPYEEFGDPMLFEAIAYCRVKVQRG